VLRDNRPTINLREPITRPGNVALAWGIYRGHRTPGNNAFAIADASANHRGGFFTDAKSAFSRLIAADALMSGCGGCRWSARD